jgi:heme-degrading monooxygenase HmoA
LIIRIWSTGIDRTRESDYREFEEEQSLPMFRKQTGFLGVLFLRSRDGAAALTLWESAEDVARLSESSTYRETVGQLESTGLLRGDQVIETFEVAATHLDLSIV